MRNIIFVLILSVSLINALNSTTEDEIQNDIKTTLKDEVTSTISTTPKLRNALNSTTVEEIQNDTKTILQDEVTSTIRTTPKLRLPGVNDPLVHFKSREHAWETFFMSLSTCSGNKLFKAKLLYTRSIMIQSMDKFWDEPYMKILLFFPIYDFKYSEHITVWQTFKCFHAVLRDPFHMRQTIRISDNSLIPPLTSIKLRFVPFVSELVDEKFMKEVRYEIKHNNGNWKDREIDPDDIASVLFQDVRFLKGFRDLIDDFEKYIFKCLDETHRMIFVENQLCKAVKKSFTNILSWEGEPPPEDSSGYQPWIGYVILSCGIVAVALIVRACYKRK